MIPVRTREQEAAEDVFFGQLVIIWARWSVIVSLIALVLWSARDVGQMTVSMLLVAALMAVNFFLHGAYALERPQNARVVTVLSVVDLVIVTGVVLLFHGPAGLANPFFVFYYPLVLAFGLVFPSRAAAGYTLAVLGAYTLVCVLTGSLHSANDVKTLVMRAITLAATGGLATYHFRLQRDRRRATTRRLGAAA